VSGNCLLKVIVCTESDGSTEMEVTETKGVAGVVVNFVESVDVYQQSQSERMLIPAIARVMLVPGLLTMILLPTLLLQRTSV
jgi:hypothetical protein